MINQSETVEEIGVIKMKTKQDGPVGDSGVIKVIFLSFQSLFVNFTPRRQWGQRMSGEQSRALWLAVEMN